MRMLEINYYKEADIKYFLFSKTIHNAPTEKKYINIDLVSSVETYHILTKIMVGSELLYTDISANDFLKMCEKEQFKQQFLDYIK